MHVLLPPRVQPLLHPLQARISLQSLGVSHMKLGGEDELRSLMRAQSVTLPQLLGFASTILTAGVVGDVLERDEPVMLVGIRLTAPCDAACRDALTFHVALPC